MSSLLSQGRQKLERKDDKKIEKIMFEKQPAIYILASKRNGTLYIGVTSDLVKRIWEHKNNFIEGFSKKYSVHYLVYFELCEDMYSAITREKNIKKWKREWKIKLIESVNPYWRDLYNEIIT